MPLIVDNTVPTPYLSRPFEHGADIVVHSLTKYLGGHGTSIGGAIVDSGKFPWAEHKQRFRRLNEPDVSYHGVVYTEALGPAAYIGRARVVPAAQYRRGDFAVQRLPDSAGHRDAVAADGPHQRQRAASRAASEAPRQGGLGQLSPASRITRITRWCRKYLSGKASGLLTFGLKGPAGQGRERGARFLDALQLFTRLVNIGDVRSLATHPASTTHRQLSPDELAQAGVTEDTVRLSIGIEHIEDLLADLDAALDAV